MFPSRHRKSEVVPLTAVLPQEQRAAQAPRKRRLTRGLSAGRSGGAVKPLVDVVALGLRPAPADSEARTTTTTPDTRDPAQHSGSPPASPSQSSPTSRGDSPRKSSSLSQAARAVMSMRQRGGVGGGVGDGEIATEPEADDGDRWSTVLSKMVQRKGTISNNAGGGSPGRTTVGTPGDRRASRGVNAAGSGPATSAERRTSRAVATAPAAGASSASASSPSKTVSLVQVLKSREVKELVKQAIVAKRWNGIKVSKSAQLSASAAAKVDHRSSVMDHWVKTARLRDQQYEGSDEETEEQQAGVESAFDLRESSGSQMYGRTLLLEESCRRAFAQSGENRSQMDLQALKAWFQMTKLKITTDFERLQPAELDLLCRRMVLMTYHPNEIVFRQGDEADALFIVFAGVVEVRVSQRVLGEKVEVTVCELTKGDYFGERALLNNDPRAATIIAKTSTELVQITRKDYNIMLKKDQLEFLQRMQVTNGLNTAKAIQNSQREYVKVLTKKSYARTRADVDMLSEYLQTLKFFRGLPKSFVRELCIVVDFLTLPAGSFVFREGEVGDLFYIIFSGSVDVIVSSKDFRGNTQQTKLINLTEGSHFGELALMKGHGIRSATVVTREECQFLVICEKDYNSTLRRMQKEDLAKRVGVLDRIPMFQTPEWTGELLKEMSYVLSEYKLATGSVLFHQGDKALQVYFVVRGELLVTKEIRDPVSQASQVVFVERIGRFRVVGDDAAAGANFNEAIYREVTMTASTPVELLVLSKYDVFHRLSRAARETLRAAVHPHVQAVVYLDRFHKTTKWDAYKEKLLEEHTNVERLHKILPATTVQQAEAKAKQRKESKKKNKKNKKPKSPKRKESMAEEGTSASPGASPTRRPHRQDGGPEQRKLSFVQVNERIDAITANSELVNVNEFLLLPPTSRDHDQTHPQPATIAHHVVSFNADAPPSATRAKQLTRTLQAEKTRQMEVLNEGNPLVYFDVETINQQHQQQLLADAARSRGVSTRRLLLLPNTGTPGSGKVIINDPAAANAMNQFFQENFIFSKPERRPRRSRQRARPTVASMAKDYHWRRMTLPTEMAIEMQQAGRLCRGDHVVVSVLQSMGNEDGLVESPTFRLVQGVNNGLEARDVAMRTMEEDLDNVEDSGSETTVYYTVPKKKFAIMPRPHRSRVSEEALQRSIGERLARQPVLSASLLQWQKRMSSSVAGNASASAAGATQAEVPSLPAAPSFLDPMALFASFQKVLVSNAEQREIAERVRRNTAATTAMSNQESPGRPTSNGCLTSTANAKLFAVVSMVLSKHEVEHAICEEPLLCVHDVFPSEIQAMENALALPPQPIKSALVCVLPVQEWIHFEDAYDWCVQLESERRDKRQSATAPSISRSKPQTPTEPMTSAGSTVTERPEWQVSKEKAHRLHQFVTGRMGIKHSEKDRRDESGFTPKPLVTLEEKIGVLHDYLATSAPASRGGVMLGKYRQMKKFGSIMKARIARSSVAHADDGL
ncbi:TPA: hypothetical protein N0F65_003659 [Lagenidium giganteum]|uniref:Cyclic nucleotide-binding domain-containing protein n=1 Tax=Lagenidium giganteum TaxID=4803 RepID=A0AAV2YJW3_9STRA|nr:TPA: hypothetical protein N0F65_003659 [Lagenidium giganteum]